VTEPHRVKISTSSSTLPRTRKVAMHLRICGRRDGNSFTCPYLRHGKRRQRFAYSAASSLGGPSPRSFSKWTTLGMRHPSVL
jgi:hypothetical protein